MAINNENETTSISMESPLLEAGRTKAKRRRQTFSAYVATLIERDLQSEVNTKEAGRRLAPQSQEVAA